MSRLMPPHDCRRVSARCALGVFASVHPHAHLHTVIDATASLVLFDAFVLHHSAPKRNTAATDHLNASIATASSRVRSVETL